MSDLTNDEKIALKALAMAANENADPAWTVKVLDALGLKSSAKSALEKIHPKLMFAPLESETADASN